MNGPIRLMIIKDAHKARVAMFSAMNICSERRKKGNGSSRRSRSNNISHRKLGEATATGGGEWREGVAGTSRVGGPRPMGQRGTRPRVFSAFSHSNWQTLSPSEHLSPQAGAHHYQSMALTGRSIEEYLHPCSLGKTDGNASQGALESRHSSCITPPWSGSCRGGLNSSGTTDSKASQNSLLPQAPNPYPPPWSGSHRGNNNVDEVGPGRFASGQGVGDKRENGMRKEHQRHGKEEGLVKLNDQAVKKVDIRAPEWEPHITGHSSGQEVCNNMGRRGRSWGRRNFIPQKEHQICANGETFQSKPGSETDVVDKRGHCWRMPCRPPSEPSAIRWLKISLEEYGK
ncbi:unnamed protein product [Choristocarpus tenellus]